MYINHKRMCALFIYLLFCASVAFASAGASTDLLAEIDGEKITRADYDAKLAIFMKTANPQAKQFFDSPEGKKDFLNQFVDVCALEKKAIKLGLNKGAEYEKALKETVNAAIAGELMREKIEAAAVSDDEVKAEYEASKANFKTPEKYHIFQISVKSPQKAAELKKAIDGGSSFIKTAKTDSIDGFKSKGGDRGFVSKDALEPEVMHAVESLKPNQVSGPIEIDDDLFLLVKYTEKEQGKTVELSAAAPQIKSKLLSLKQREAHEKHVEELKKEVGMVVNKEVAELLRKESLTDEEKEKVVFKTAQGREKKLKEIVDEDLQQIPAFIRPQLLQGKGLDDFISLICGREAAVSYVEKNYQALSAKYKDILTEAKNRTAVRFLLDSTIGKISVDEPTLKEYYNKNIEQFKTPPQTRASHILLKEEADAKAVLEELKKDPSKFAEIAKEKSLCPSGKQAGGDLGLFGEGQMVKEFDEACKTAEIGKIVGPVKTNFGYHIIRVDERKAAGTLKFEEVKDQLEQQLLPEKQHEAFIEYVKKIKEEFNVKVYEEKL